MAVGALGGISLLVGSVAGLLGGLTCAALIHTFVPLLPVHSPWSFVVLAELLALWAAGCAALLALGTRLAPPVGAAYEAATRSFRLPGSWVPMGLILVVFLMKYGIGVQLALEPTLARAPGFAFAVTALYGLLSGLFAARTLRVLRLARPAPALGPFAR